jgi:hypothetical protein
MCYMLYLSTGCADDLSLQSSDLVRFQRPSVETHSAYPRILKYEYQWFVGSKSQCSCTFRHLCRESVDLGFGAPEDWFPEDQEHIEATRALYGILNDIVQRGHQVDVLDCWSGDEDKEAVALEVSLSAVSVDRVRLFEGHVFDLKP